MLRASELPATRVLQEEELEEQKEEEEGEVYALENSRAWAAIYSVFRFMFNEFRIPPLCRVIYIAALLSTVDLLGSLRLP